MRWDKVKRGAAPTDLLVGVTVESEVVDGVLKSVVLADDFGNVVKVQSGPSYSDSLEVLTPAEPERVKRFVVGGEIHGVPVHEVHEHRSEADDRADVLNREGAVVAVTEVELVVSEATGQPVDADDELPF